MCKKKGGKEEAGVERIPKEFEDSTYFTESWARKLNRRKQTEKGNDNKRESKERDKKKEIL